MEFRIDTSELYSRAHVERIRPVVTGLNSVKNLEASSARLNRQRIIDRLKAIDEEVRARLEEEAKKNFGSPEYINTRGPDNNLYAIDGEVVGGIKPQSEASFRAQQARMEAQERSRRAALSRESREAAQVALNSAPTPGAQETAPPLPGVVPGGASEEPAFEPALIGAGTGGPPPVAVKAPAPPIIFQPSPYAVELEPIGGGEAAYEPPELELPGSGAPPEAVSVGGGLTAVSTGQTSPVPLPPSYTSATPVAGTPASVGTGIGGNADFTV